MHSDSSGKDIIYTTPFTSQVECTLDHTARFSPRGNSRARRGAQKAWGSLPTQLSAAFGGCPHYRRLLSRMSLSFQCSLGPSSRPPSKNRAQTGPRNPVFCTCRMDSVWPGNSPHPYSHSHCSKDPSARHIQVSTRESCLIPGGEGSELLFYCASFVRGQL